MFPHSRENCLLESGFSYQFYESASTFGIYEQVINLDVLNELLCSTKQPLFAKKKNGRRFHTNAKVMKTFISVNNIMAVNQLPSTPVNWDRDHFVGNIDIHSIFT